jgi:hypothetical protein
MQLRERASVVLELVAVVAVTATLWLSPHATPQAPHHVGFRTLGACADSPTVDAVHVKVEAASLEVMLPEADRLYRAHRFDEAARVARDAASHDARFQSVAELYIQFAHAWKISIDPSGRPTAQFEALREARKLDVVLGGVYASELDTYLVRVTPKAAVSYTSMRRFEEAAVAMSVADALGLGDNGNIKAVRMKLNFEQNRAH